MKRFYRAIAVFLSVILSISFPVSSIASTVPASADTDYSGGNKTWIVDINKKSGYTFRTQLVSTTAWTANHKIALADKALVSYDSETGKYDIKIKYSGYSVNEAIQIINPSTLSDFMKDMYDNYGKKTFSKFPYASYNIPNAENWIVPNGHSKYISIDEKLNSYFWTGDEVRITAGNSQMDEGLIEFSLTGEQMEAGIVMNSFYSGEEYLSTYNNYTLVQFDMDSKVEVPDSLILDAGTKTMGYEWSKQEMWDLKFASRGYGTNVMGPYVTSFFEDIFEDEVTVTVDESGEMQATFTFDSSIFSTDRGDNQVTAVWVAESRETQYENIEEELRPYWLNRAVGVKWKKIDIKNESTLTLSFQDLWDRKLIEIHTVGTDSNDNNKGDNRFAYWGDLYLTEEILSHMAEPATATTNSGIVLKTDVNTLQQGYKFVDVEDAYFTQGYINNIKSSAASEDYIKLYAYQIQDANGNRVVPVSPVTIEIQIPAEFNIDKVGLPPRTRRGRFTVCRHRAHR